MYKSGRFYMTVGAPPERTDISVQIFVDKVQIAEVHDEPGYPVVEFYDLEQPTKVVKVEEIIDLLNRAVRMLAERPRAPK